MDYQLPHGKIEFTICNSRAALATFDKCPTCGGPVSKALVVVTALVDDDPESPKADMAIWCVACFWGIFKLWATAADELERALKKSVLELVK